MARLCPQSPCGQVLAGQAPRATPSTSCPCSPARQASALGRVPVPGIQEPDRSPPGLSCSQYGRHFEACPACAGQGAQGGTGTSAHPRPEVKGGWQRGSMPPEVGEAGAGHTGLRGATTCPWPRCLPAPPPRSPTRGSCCSLNTNPTAERTEASGSASSPQARGSPGRVFSGEWCVRRSGLQMLLRRDWRSGQAWGLGWGPGGAGRIPGPGQRWGPWVRSLSCCLCS